VSIQIAVLREERKRRRWLKGNQAWIQMIVHQNKRRISRFPQNKRTVIQIRVEKESKDQRKSQEERAVILMKKPQ
jgi:hypothetical protein